jgi:hypothetical protein
MQIAALRVTSSAINEEGNMQRDARASCIEETTAPQ